VKGRPSAGNWKLATGNSRFVVQLASGYPFPVSSFPFPLDVEELIVSMLKEFREFALKGNVMDLAVGVIIGAAFGKIVTSLVDDLIMPVVGRFTGGLDFTNYYLPLVEVPAGTEPSLAAVREAGLPVLAWGNFLSVVINFTIMAFVIFQMVKLMNRVKRQQETAPATPAATPEDIVLLREIRDTLRR
jgi:large conductance mechanosensitive channel